jgi:hypothetical protein
MYCDEHDAYFNPLTDTWLDSTCDDSNCEYCSTRPEKPSAVESLQSCFMEIEFDRLKKQVETLTKRIDRLEKTPVPVPSIPFPSVIPSDWYGNCPKCGLKLGQVMGYCCPQPDCPTGLGPTMCSGV